MTESEVFEELKKIMAENFELDPGKITMGANLEADLDLDSIDAIDMISKIQKKTGCRLTADSFKSVRTVRDVVNVILTKVNAL